MATKPMTVEQARGVYELAKAIWGDDARQSSFSEVGCTAQSHIAACRIQLERAEAYWGTEFDSYDIECAQYDSGLS